MGVDEENSVIVRTIISLAHNLAADVIAEGVETEEQMKVLSMLGCDELQGYLFSKPVEAQRLGSIFEMKLPGKEFVSAA